MMNLKPPKNTKNKTKNNKNTKTKTKQKEQHNNNTTQHTTTKQDLLRPQNSFT